MLTALLSGGGAVGVAPGAAVHHAVQALSPQTARVAQVHVSPGDVVDVGAPLLTLESAELDHAVAVARLALARAEQLAAASAVDVVDDDLSTSARLAQEAERASVERQAVVADVRKDGAELAQLDAQIEAQRALVARKLADTAQLDVLLLRRAAIAERVAESEALLKASDAHEAATKKRLEAWRRDRRVGGIAGGDDVDTRVAPAQAEARLRAEELRDLERRQKALVLRATLAGQIQRVDVVVGDTAIVEAPLVVITDVTPRQVVAWVDERQAARVAVRQRARLNPSDQQSLARGGVVDAVSPAITELPERFRPVPTQPAFGRAVYITLDAGAASPLPGQAFDVTFEAAPPSTSTSTSTSRLSQRDAS